MVEPEQERVTRMLPKGFNNKDVPWVDFRLKKEMMDHLRNAIDNPPSQLTETDATNSLAGNISKSKFIEDKDNLFCEGVLNGVSEHMYYQNSWRNHYDVNIAKIVPPPIFKLKSLWVNYQKQYEFNPPHNHDGLFSFVVFMKIPTNWKEQHALPISANSNSPRASDFQFLLGQGQGQIKLIPISLSPEDEGRMLFFPAWVAHQVFPFYGTEESRITVGGNIELLKEKGMGLKEKESLLENMEKQVRSMRKSIKQNKKNIKEKTPI